ncbi:MAG TPA: alginate lyase family protein [Pyrinomonadaceae bacterium]|nr:alginate lyase family protein [Pyrinomonadaceae bacterium]
MPVLHKIKRALRGEVKLTTAALEALRRSRASFQQRKERASLDESEPLALTQAFARMSAEELLSYFRGPREAKFLDDLFAPVKVDVASAERIVNDHSWPLLGFGEQSFGKEIEWRRDLLSNYVWPLDYHRDVKLIRADGSDVRVLWELNRLGHFLTLACAYASTHDERYSSEFFAQLQSWHEQNPYGRGPNWTCAMEVALRAMNLLAAFEVFRHSPQLSADFLKFFLQLLQQHGTYIRRNLEFSYIATSNHYLSDVVGLFWLGLLLPELRDASEWREFGLRQMLLEMDKQVLADGADFEASTGYHRFVTELFLYSFLLCRANNVEIEKRYWSRLHQMLGYIRAYLRPDGFAPMIGDTDSGQILPVVRRRAGDHAYVLDILKPETQHAGSQSFPHAGIYIMRDGDLYLCFNASGVGINGRGSHGHNDVLSIEVSARGRAFIVDPGTYVYSADLAKRHEFRSTAYHSTVQIDGLEQNTINVNTPFVIGNEARPRVLEWKTSDDFDKVVAEHYGYPVTHRRTVTFDKRGRVWVIDDEFFGDGEHVYEARFHFAPGLDVRVRGARVEAGGLVVALLNSEVEATLESQPVSRDYGEMSDAVAACWRVEGRVSRLSWKISLTTDFNG